MSKAELLAAIEDLKSQLKPQWESDHARIAMRMDIRLEALEEKLRTLIAGLSAPRAPQNDQ